MADHNTSQAASPPQGTADHFESLYVKKDFHGAAQFLLQHKSIFPPGLFHYNLGTVYIKLEDYAVARYHFELAVKEGFLTNATLNNLNFTKTRLSVDDLSTSTVFIDQWANGFISIPGPLYGTFTLVFLLVVMFILRVKKKMFRPVPVVILGLLVISPLLVYFLYVKETNCAIALKDTPIYEGPSKIFSEKGVAKAGTKIVLGSIKDGWFYIKHPQSLVGWVHKDQLGLL